MSTIKLGVGRLYFPSAEPRIVSCPGFDLETYDKPLNLGKFTISGKITNVRVQDFPVKRFKVMRVRHKATGRGAIAYPVKDGLVIVQFNNIKAMGPLSSGWHLYPRHHFKRRK